jgi:hypothetical protein
VRVNESEFTPEQGKILAIVGSNNIQGFTFGDIKRRLSYEGVSISDTTIGDILKYLCDRELIYLHIYGDKWYANPRVKFEISSVRLTSEMIHPRIVEHLKNCYPKEISLGEIIKVFLKEDSRLNPQLITKAVSTLVFQRRVLRKKFKYCWNQHPPMDGSNKRNYHKKPIQRNESETNLVKTANLIDEQLLKLKKHIFPRLGSMIVVEKSNGQIKKILVYDMDIAQESLLQSLTEVEKGRYRSCIITDAYGGVFKIWKDNVAVKATYTNTVDRIAHLYRLLR